jgi:putative endonuclease
MWYVYIIQCKDDKLYTGITTDIDRRMVEHNAGKGGRFTRFRTPVKLVYSQEAASRSAALKREAGIKKLSRGEKLGLILSAI